MIEIWKDAIGYEGLYQFSNCGRVKSLSSGKILKTGRTAYGYAKVHLTKNGRHIQNPVHRLVAKAFIPNPENKPQVNHKDGNKLNNNVENLEWNTAKENSNHRDAVIWGGLNKHAELYSIPVLCVEQGLVYRSSAEAARAVNGDANNIRLLFKSSVHHAVKGFHFKELKECKGEFPRWTNVMSYDSYNIWRKNERASSIKMFAR